MLLPPHSFAFLALLPLSSALVDLRPGGHRNRFSIPPVTNSTRSANSTIHSATRVHRNSSTSTCSGTTSYTLDGTVTVTSTIYETNSTTTFFGSPDLYTPPAAPLPPCSIATITPTFSKGPDGKISRPDLVKPGDENEGPPTSTLFTVIKSPVVVYATPPPTFNGPPPATETHTALNDPGAKSSVLPPGTNDATSPPSFNKAGAAGPQAAVSSSQAQPTLGGDAQPGTSATPSQPAPDAAGAGAAAILGVLAALGGASSSGGYAPIPSASGTSGGTGGGSGVSQPISGVAQPNVKVGGTTGVGAGSPTANPNPPPPFAVTISNVPISISPNNNVVIGGQTIPLAPGSAPTSVVYNGQTYSVNPSQIIAPGTTVAIPTVVPTGATFPAPILLPETYGGITFSVGSSIAVIGGSTYTIGPGATSTTAVVNGQTISIGPSGVAFASTTLGYASITSLVGSASSVAAAAKSTSSYSATQFTGAGITSRNLGGTTFAVGLALGMGLTIILAL